MPTDDLIIKEFTGKRILVAGEAILDEYLQGRSERLSREAPVPVVLNPTTSYRCGGAANAAANIASLGASVTLVTSLGDDSAGEVLRQSCTNAGIQLHVIKQAETSHKQRILSADQQLLRIDYMHNQQCNASKLSEEVILLLPEYDAVLLSDYGADLLAEAQSIITAARGLGIPVAVDPHSCDYYRYSGASLLKPSAEELMQGISLSDKNLPLRMEKIIAKYNFGAILLTGGKEGMLLSVPDLSALHLYTEALDVYDVVGAGDTVAAVMTLGLACKADLFAAARLANRAAGIVVSKLGAVTISATALEGGGRRNHGSVVTTLDILQEELGSPRNLGKTVVMTNGCFDILHAGHLDTLGAAAKMGDLLVVALNDDKSIQKLKGKSRPVMPLELRQQLLAGLGCIDYVVSFSGPDAASVISAVSPDVYVKGGDWKDKETPEAKAALEVGAQIVYQNFRQQLSTTEIVKAIQTGKSITRNN